MADRYYPYTTADGREIKVPSVTTILDVINKPYLNRWKAEQAIYAAAPDIRGQGYLHASYNAQGITLPFQQVTERIGDLWSASDYLADNLARWIEAAEAEAIRTARIGTLVHETLATFHRGEDYTPGLELAYQEFPEILPMVDAYLIWYGEHVLEVLAVEKVVYGMLPTDGNEELYYAGTLDTILLVAPGTTLGYGKAKRTLARPTVIMPDFKTGTAYYPQFGFQMAGYDWAYSTTHEDNHPEVLVTIRLDRETKRLYTKEWDYGTSFDAFSAATRLWYALNPQGAATTANEPDSAWVD